MFPPNLIFETGSANIGAFNFSEILMILLKYFAEFNCPHTIKGL